MIIFAITKRNYKAPKTTKECSRFCSAKKRAAFFAPFSVFSRLKRHFFASILPAFNGGVPVQPPFMRVNRVQKHDIRKTKNTI